MSDRRVVFFLVAAVLCAVLVPATPREFQWVPKLTSAAYVVLAILVALDTISRRTRR